MIPATSDQAVTTPDQAIPDQAVPAGDITVPPAPAGMVFIPSAGKTFTMGGPYVPAPHKVTFTKSFFLDTHEVTRAKYKALMGADLPSYFTARNLPAQTDPTGPATQGTSGCVMRGGSWYAFSSNPLVIVM